MMILVAETIAEMENYAAGLASRVAPGQVWLLEGNLGAGKSTFARALIRSLCNDRTLEVPSPTFTLVQTYEAMIAPIYHFDLYRLDDPNDIWPLGWEDATARDAVALVEWPDRLGVYCPAKAIRVLFDQPSAECRIMKVEGL
jgi:tRNA threonylcarbamoyladenosine biosynthesis protein TsaE